MEQRAATSHLLNFLKVTSALAEITILFLLNPYCSGRIVHEAC